MPGKLLEDKVAIITGAARGIGAATARLFVEHGARLVINDLDDQPLKHLIDEIQANNGEAHGVAGDITNPSLPEKLVDEAQRSWGSLDIIVNNAGYTWDGTIHKMDDEQWHAMLDVHLTAAFRLIRAAAPAMRTRAKEEMRETGQAQARKIINISSTTGTRGNFGQVNYAAAKAGIIGLTKSLAKEWGRYNIQVNSAAFGFIDTRLTRSQEESETISRGDATIQLGIPAEIRNRGTALIPMGRPGTVEEAAGLLLFFASPLSNYVSGQVVEATGGA
ncbi:MAG: SDR family oxidoreductase [Chloroflexi bacterium]|nr:SDR family oxidoreductase [Chloroflexota bacterium]